MLVEWNATVRHISVLLPFLVSDSEEEMGPRLKPVFVRKKDRVTVMEREREAQRQKQVEIEAKKMAEERRKYTLKVPTSV
jgi:hypothetical protein